MRGPSEGQRPALVRWRMDPSTGRVSETMLDDPLALSSLRFNDARAGQDYRFGYTAAANDTLQRFGCIVYKHDLVSGRNQDP